jgi:hypothetical protein
MANTTAHHGKARVRAPSQPVARDVSPSVSSHSLANDITIAKTIATAVRATPGVVDLSPGLLALAATYGPHERLVGVVVRHPGPHETAVDVHVTVAVEATPPDEEQGGVASSWSVQTETSDRAALTRVANRVREAAYRAMQGLHVAPPSAVDVFIDDIQMPILVQPERGVGSS